MPRMPRYNRDTHKLEWVEADASSPEYQTWKSKLRANGRKGAAKRTAKATSSTSETLDDETPSASERPAPSGPKRAGGANTRPQSMLAPVLPRIAQALVVGIQAGTRNLTGGRAPMTAQEATAVAVPAIRIADRTAAKYIKRTGKVTPNQEDAALIVLTIVVWLIGWIVASLQNKPRQAQAGQQAQSAPETTDLFAGSEPVGPPPPPAPGRSHRPAPTSEAGTEATAGPAISDEDESDLFAGSEPIAPGGAAEPTPARRRVSPEQAAANERFWQAIVPTDRGETLAS